MTNRIYEITTKIPEYRIVNDLQCDFTQIGRSELFLFLKEKKSDTNCIFSTFGYFFEKMFESYRNCSFVCVLSRYEFNVEGRNFVVDVVDPVEDYVKLMQQIFDFDKVPPTFYI